MKTLTKKQVIEIFKSEILPAIDPTDKPMIRESFTNFVYSLYQGGEVTEKLAQNITLPKTIVYRISVY
jgi:hypothetical protein